jgi:hypothetical protein
VLASSPRVLNGRKGVGQGGELTWGGTQVDAVTVAGCKVLAALCLELDNTRRFLSPTTDGMASLLQLLTDTAKIRCFSAAADVLVNIVAHQPQDPSIAAQVVQGDGSLASSDSSAAPLTDSLGAIFLSMHIASVEQRGSDAADFHVQVCKMLFFLCEDEGNRSLCTQARYLGALDELFAQCVTHLTEVLRPSIDPPFLNWLIDGLKARHMSTRGCGCEDLTCGLLRAGTSRTTRPRPSSTLVRCGRSWRRGRRERVPSPTTWQAAQGTDGWAPSTTRSWSFRVS